LIITKEPLTWLHCYKRSSPISNHTNVFSNWNTCSNVI